MRNDALGEAEHAIVRALLMVRDLAEADALPPVLLPLQHLVPPRGFRIHVELEPYDDAGRPDERGPAWDPRDGEVHISYEPMRDDARGPGPAPASGPPDAQAALRDIIAVVARAEADPAFKFLALKYLRDQLLPRNVGWARAPHEAQIQINAAIDAGALVTAKVENPRQPQYPVTAVSLRRDHPMVVEVVTVLGLTLSGGGPDMGGAPSSEGGGATDDHDDEPS